ncbi:uncharacterized protein EHS24_002665 [Apiotrichum porosum]|uniref:Protein transport protein SFT2 n=1 Tax=Apiotrichum porosum TaxID=105984 RepID=A0A427XHK1_9TREE|nr:uncharacterized protein EHS24_002665 [Apiotrichum porosum]RSH78204.1 hypothetical protein EHS24_002665 [Apiotrichum porosum]
MPPGWLNLDATPEDVMFGGEKSAWPSLELTKMQRLMGFGACFVGGFAISLLGAILFLLGQGGALAILFALGAIVSLVGTGFLVGFATQWKMMWKPVRLVATIIMFAAIVLTFVSAFVLPAVLCIIFVIIQYLAMAWYSLSYIPYARTGVKNLASGLW